MKDGSSRFFENRGCEYFPCHDGVPDGEFNCLFCYCPLYALGKRCGGNFRYTEQGIKDCSGCSFPHRRESYDAVLNRYPDVKRVIALADGEEDP